MGEIDAALVSVALPSDAWRLSPADVQTGAMVATRDGEWSIRPQLRVEATLVDGPPDPEGLAATLVQAFEDAGDRVVVEHRERVGSARTPVVVQLVRADTIVDGRFEAVRCAHAIIGMTDRRTARHGVVYVLTMTADARELPDLIDEFKTMVGSLRAAGVS